MRHPTVTCQVGTMVEHGMCLGRAPRPNPLEGFVRKLLLLVGSTLLMAACSDMSTAPQNPVRQAPTGRASSDLSCASGYVVAYDENGNPYCAADPNVRSQTRTRKL